MKSEISIISESARDVFTKLARITTASSRSATFEDKARCAKEFGAVYAKEFVGDNLNRLLGCELSEVSDAI